jgi:hypothetical protein
MPPPSVLLLAASATSSRTNWYPPWRYRAHADDAGAFRCDPEPSVAFDVIVGNAVYLFHQRERDVALERVLQVRWRERSVDPDE